MITSIINGQEVHMKKSEIINYLSGKNTEEIKLAVEHIQYNSELQRVERFSDYCIWTLTKIEEASKKEGRDKSMYEDLARIYLPNLKKVIENHGVPTTGHLDDYADRIIKLLDSSSYSYLLENEQVKKSYEGVKLHRQEKRHSQEYESDLNYLHGLISDIHKRKHMKIGISKRFNLETAASA